jgi:hypothetical protein
VGGAALSVVPQVHANIPEVVDEGCPMDAELGS